MPGFFCRTWKMVAASGRGRRQRAVGQNADLFPHLEFSERKQEKRQRRSFSASRASPPLFHFHSSESPTATDGALFALCVPPTFAEPLPRAHRLRFFFLQGCVNTEEEVQAWAAAPRRCPHKLFVFGCWSFPGCLMVIGFHWELSAPLLSLSWACQWTTVACAPKPGSLVHLLSWFILGCQLGHFT